MTFDALVAVLETGVKVSLVTFETLVFVLEAGVKVILFHQEVLYHEVLYQGTIVVEDLEDGAMKAFPLRQKIWENGV